jgi:prophage regulatory protein
MYKVEKITEVIKRVGIKRSSLYALINEGKFPAPIKLGARSSGWISSEVDEFIESRIAARGGELRCRERAQK